MSACCHMRRHTKAAQANTHSCPARHPASAMPGPARGDVPPPRRLETPPLRHVPLPRRTAAPLLGDVPPPRRPSPGSTQMPRAIPVPWPPAVTAWGRAEPTRKPTPPPPDRTARPLCGDQRANGHGLEGKDTGKLEKEENVLFFLSDYHCQSSIVNLSVVKAVRFCNRQEKKNKN